MGVDQVMLKLFDDRPMVEALMERALEHAVAYARALADGGADMLSGGDSPAADRLRHDSGQQKLWRYQLL